VDLAVDKTVNNLMVRLDTSAHQGPRTCRLWVILRSASAVGGCDARSAAEVGCPYIPESTVPLVLVSFDRPVALPPRSPSGW
jgi:hypothetical protein